MATDKGKTFYVIVRNEDDRHWTSHSDFVDGKFFSDRASATAALSSLTSPSTSPTKPFPPASATRPSPTAPSASTSSTSTVGSVDGVKFEVRKIAARSLCGSWTWWFVNEEARGVS